MLFKLLEFPPLPAKQVLQSISFEHPGVNYFGLLNVRVNSGITSVNFIIFTCLVVRAIHLEIVFLSAECFLKAFKRFVARRELPKTMWSDNGTQFILSKKCLMITREIII